MNASDTGAQNVTKSCVTHDDVASILAVGVLRLRARRNLSDTTKKPGRSAKTDLISASERSVHDHRRPR